MKKKIIHLRQIIKRHNYLYYSISKPRIDDWKYDQLSTKLYELEKIHPQHDLQNRVGSEPQDVYKKIYHHCPMLSLNNACSIKDVLAFINRIYKILKINNINIHCEPKIDGVSFSAIFRHGKLLHASTRGDGIIGEEITENIRQIRNFPTSINAYRNVEVKGEIYMQKSIFAKLNLIQKKSHKRLFSNPRNASSGSLRQLNPLITKHRCLNYFIWGGTTNMIDTQENLMSFFANCKFTVNNTAIVTNSIKNILLYHDILNSLKSRINYDIDGVVYKINDHLLQNKIGHGKLFPKWAIAHKFSSQKGITQLKDILVQVGRTGAITPVAILQPINLGGVLINKALLHNENDINRKNIRIGDNVIIKRAGDVIPQIESVSYNTRNKYCQTFIWPQQCPFCYSSIAQEKRIKRCTGSWICKEQVISRLIHFVSQNTFYITGLSQKNIRQFHRKKLIQEFADILAILQYKKEVTKIVLTWNGWGNKSLFKLFNSIQKVQKIRFDRFLYSLGIRYIGITTARILTQHLQHINDILNIKKRINKQIIQQLGLTAINSLTYFFKDKKNRSAVINLMQKIKIVYFNSQKYWSPLKGKIIALTGTFKRFHRTALIKEINLLGACVIPAISKHTDILIYGKHPGKKITRAKILKIKLMNENEVEKVIQHNHESKKPNQKKEETSKL